jgi:hypothetical protein
MPGNADYLATELEHVARHLRLAGDTGLYRELQDAVTRATRTVPEEIRSGLAPRLPNPYAADLSADLRITVSKRYGQADPGVTVTATTRVKKRKLRRLNRGLLEHPLWGNREHWYLQQVTPGWFTGPARDAGARAREEIIAAMDRVAVAATRKGP